MRALSKENEGVNFLLLVIDTFSKYGWIVPLKNKKAQTIVKALKEIFKESGRRPNKLWTDKGTEFFNKDVKDLVYLYATENEEKSSIAERWIRTMKEKVFKYFTDNNTNKYIDVLPDLVEDYNNTVHSSTKFTPVEASKKENELKVRRNLYPDRYKYIDVLPDLEEDYNNTVHSSTKFTPVEASKEENELKVLLNLYPDRYKTSRLNPKFSVGDMVRITKKKKVLEKGYTTRWTEEIFTIKKIQKTNPITYILEDLQGEEIKGTFYEPELQKTEQQIYRIEKVIENEKGRSFVKWKGYPDKFNSWVDNKDLIDLS